MVYIEPVPAAAEVDGLLHDELHRVHLVYMLHSIRTLEIRTLDEMIHEDGSIGIRKAREHGDDGLQVLLHLVFYADKDWVNSEVNSIWGFCAIIYQTHTSGIQANHRGIFLSLPNFQKGAHTFAASFNLS